MRIFLLLLILTFTLSCATRKIEYNRNKILKKYTADYQVFLDDEKMNLKSTYLDKNNIESIELDNRNKTLKINQFRAAEFFDIKELTLDRMISQNKNWKEKSIEIIISVKSI